MDTNTANSTNASKPTSECQSAQQTEEEMSRWLEAKAHRIKELEQQHGVILTPSHDWDTNLDVPPEVASNTGTGKPAAAFRSSFLPPSDNHDGRGSINSTGKFVEFRSEVLWKPENPPNQRSFMNAEMFRNIVNRNISKENTEASLSPEGGQSRSRFTVISNVKPFSNVHEVWERCSKIKEAFTELDKDVANSFDTVDGALILPPIPPEVQTLLDAVERIVGVLEASSTDDGNSRN